MKRRRSEPMDPYLVGFAAKQMGMGEFQLFMKAYRAWYGEEPTEAMIEPYFKRYMTNSVAPFWVRHHARAYINNPDLRMKLAEEKKVSHIVYFVPLVVEYLLIMYYLVIV